MKRWARQWQYNVMFQPLQEVRRHLPEEVEDFAYLSSMAVDAPARRQGAAQALLTEAERLTCALCSPQYAVTLSDSFSS